MPKKKETIEKYTDKEALDFHIQDKPGKIEIISSKQLSTQRDLSLAYSPGVAVPVLEISKNPQTAYEYTSKGNLVAVVSNGSAILGLGNLGALASKPVMEGKSVLFKRFADIDSIDIEVDSQDAEDIIKTVRNIACSFGGINLEDIGAPDCFVIEQKLKELVDIPIFHDDQHGTAIITTAGLINALDISGKSIKDVKIVVNGAGASAIACTELFKNSGVPNENVTMCDRKGVIYRGREGVDQWKSKHAIDTEDRTLEQAIKGADVVLGLSAAGAITQDMIKSMAKNPIIFACANPEPEIRPEKVLEVRDDAIIATGRSDYPNQVNNLIGFPYIFRGALDVQAKTINEEMKVAAAQAIAKLAREDVPDEVVTAYGGDRPHYGKNYIIPSTFDPRLITTIPTAVAKAAMDSGVAQKPIKDFDAYINELEARLDPSVGIMQGINSKIKKAKKRIVFAEGEDEESLKAAIAFKNYGLGEPILIANQEKLNASLKKIGLDENFNIEVTNSTDTEKSKKYKNYLYEKLQRKGILEKECDKMVKSDRVTWGSCMVACGDADGMVAGNTRHFSATVDKLSQSVGARSNEVLFGLCLYVTKGKTILIADTNVIEFPTSEELVEIAISSARVAETLGFEPRVAFLSHSTFGQPETERTKRVRQAVEMLEKRKVDFLFDGEMQPDVALNPKFQSTYSFSKIVGNANVLVMPSIHAAAVSTKMLKELGGGKVIGPLLIGLAQPIEVAPLRSSSSEILNLASIAAYSSEIIKY
ncbi:MAG: NADP-dependent malic enzyme [Pelagibacteraceae bacterium]|jgi:malate dehydrogenase (oxaloacetate-decarboxylating)(NADP+)|nr:NADP-dependent malic enzyme [Pelagibacteraceae bacterium]OUV88399.1 MAG: NADP-dependent malic enzyme [Pelagibacteraceae bacterium TMED146]